jgi:hypothetical protein
MSTPIGPVVERIFVAGAWDTGTCSTAPSGACYPEKVLERVALLFRQDVPSD